MLQAGSSFSTASDSRRRGSRAGDEAGARVGASGCGIIGEDPGSGEALVHPDPPDPPPSPDPPTKSWTFRTSDRIGVDEDRQPDEGSTNAGPRRGPDLCRAARTHLSMLI